MLSDSKVPSKPNKVELRQSILRDLKSLSATYKQQKSIAIQNNLTVKLKNKSGYWSAFQSMATEPQISWASVSETIQWCFPKIENDHMTFKKSVTQFQKNETYW